uniref:Zinc finger protein 292 n=1 Tax=Equus asinus TaxID=9793 RepID=A0A9L0IRT9_EQUAS
MGTGTHGAATEFPRDAVSRAWGLFLFSQWTGPPNSPRNVSTLLEYAEKWKTSEDPLPLLEVYTVAIQSYVKARPYLTSECENVALVLERLALSCVELLLCLPVELSDKQWEQFQALVQVAHEKLMENGSCELHFLATLAQETGVWKNPVLCTILSQEPLDKDKGSHPGHHITFSRHVSLGSSWL